VPEDSEDSDSDDDEVENAALESKRALTAIRVRQLRSHRDLPLDYSNVDHVTEWMDKVGYIDSVRCSDNCMKLSLGLSLIGV
jgi:hypothetical protein